MTAREYFRLFLGSATGIVLLFASLFAGAAAGLAVQATPAFRAALGLATAIAAFGILFALASAAGLGPRAALAEEERRNGLKARARLRQAAEARERLAALRIGSAAVAKARDLVVLEAGRFLEAADSAWADASGKEGRPRPAYDPASVAAVEEALSLVGAWQKEADESASERRFGAADAHAFPDAEARVVEGLRRQASALVAGRDLVSAAPPAPDLVSIEEELKR